MNKLTKQTPDQIQSRPLIKVFTQENSPEILAKWAPENYLKGLEETPEWAELLESFDFIGCKFIKEDEEKNKSFKNYYIPQNLWIFRFTLKQGKREEITFKRIFEIIDCLFGDDDQPGGSYNWFLDELTIFQPCFE
jgi:hypothetical protein